MATLKCIYPQFIGKPGSQRLVPCGQCYHCRRKVVRQRQGQAVLEQRFPYYREHLDPDNQHFLTLTYKKPPMTEPRPHEFGFVWENGESIPWNGPFVSARKRIRKFDGIPHYDLGDETYDLLEPHNIAQEHERYLREKVGWSDSLIDQWLSGNYEPVETLRVHDVQRYIKRVRKHYATHSDLPPLRFLWATEYGGVTQRPHYHLCIWGVPHSQLDALYDCWEDFEDNGHVFPWKLEAKLSKKSVMRDKAATYQAKDLVKSRHVFEKTPALFDRARPKVDGSRRPPIGAGAYDWWLNTWIKDTVEKAYAVPFGNELCREQFVAYNVRRNYTVVHVPMGIGQKTQSFPTSEQWRKKVREDLEISDEVWESTTQLIEKEQVIYGRAIQNNVDGIGDEFKEHKKRLREKADEAEKRERDRVSKKRSQLLAAGKLRPSL